MGASLRVICIPELKEPGKFPEDFSLFDLLFTLCSGFGEQSGWSGQKNWFLTLISTQHSSHRLEVQTFARNTLEDDYCLLEPATRSGRVIPDIELVQKHRVFCCAI